MGGDFGEKVGLGRDGPELDPPESTNRSYGPGRNAVICERSGRVCLVFHVGNLRRSPLIGATIRASLVRFSPANSGNYRKKEAEIETV